MSNSDKYIILSGIVFVTLYYFFTIYKNNQDNNKNHESSKTILESEIKTENIAIISDSLDQSEQSNQSEQAEQAQQVEHAEQTNNHENKLILEIFDEILNGTLDKMFNTMSNERLLKFKKEKIHENSKNEDGWIFI